MAPSRTTIWRRRKAALAALEKEAEEIMKGASKESSEDNQHQQLAEALIELTDNDFHDVHVSPGNYVIIIFTTSTIPPITSR